MIITYCLFSALAVASLALSVAGAFDFLFAFAMNVTSDLTIS